MSLIPHDRQAGRQDDFAALFAQYKNLVYKTAYLMLGDAAEAEDALQEVFVQVYKSLPSFDPRKGAFTTWLHRITIHHCLNRRRKRQVASQSLEAIPPDLLEQPAPSADRQALQAAISALGEKQRAVVILRYYWELPYAEIAQVLDIPLGTVKSRLDLALRTLRRQLDADSDPALSKLTSEVE